jgi:transcription antitermination factor NusG
MRKVVDSTGKPSGSGEVKWYAVYLRSKNEKKVHSELTRKQVHCFLPMVEEVRLWSDRKKRIQVPLFPGYVFVQIDLGQRLSVLQTEGVVRFVGTSDRPSSIPENQIRWVQIVVGHPETVRREQYLSAGQPVQVTAGPFKGVRGFVSRFKGSTRIVIALESIARAVSVEIAPEFLEPVGTEKSVSVHTPSV